MAIQTLQSLFVSLNTRQIRSLWSRSPCLTKSRPRDGLCQSRGFFQIDRSKWCRPWWQSLTVWRGPIPMIPMKKEIAASGFKLYGYTPEEYYQNKTSAFPSIVNSETGWIFWSGGTRASYLSIKKKSPRSEKAIMKFISLGQMGLRSKGKSKPCTWSQQVWQVLMEWLLKNVGFSLVTRLSVITI